MDKDITTACVNEAAAADLEKDELGQTGGSSGGGTHQGDGEVSGGTTDREATLAGTAHGAASEAAALGPADGSLADRAASGEGLVRAGQRSNAGAEPTGAEAIGVGAGRGEAGSGTAPDRGDLGGGGSGLDPASSPPDRLAAPPDTGVKCVVCICSCALCGCGVALQHTL